MTEKRCKIQPYLEENKVEFELLRHRPDFTAPETAQDTHTPGREFAKSVLMRIDGEFVLVVLPANQRVDVQKLEHALGARSVQLADEDDLRRLFPDSEVGAEPPFGNLYGVPVYLDPTFEGHEHVTFNAGRHDEAIRMRYRDFVRLVHPRILTVARSY